MGAATEPARSPAVHSTWIADDGPALLVHVHVPADQQARGVVVLCSPVAKEHVDTYRGIALVGQLLADRGIAAVRFDLPGVGDSDGAQQDPELVRHWLAGVDRVIDFASGLGVGAPVVVGLRLGGLLAAVAVTNRSANAAAGGLALWDPVLSGSRYLRQQSLMYRVSTDTSGADDLVHVLGADLSPAAAGELKHLSMDSVDRESLNRIPVLLAVRASDAITPAVSALAGRLGVEPEIVTGHEDFIEPRGYVGEIPRDSVNHLVGWLDAQLNNVRHAVRLRPQKSAVIGDVVESIERIGSDRLFAIRSEPQQSTESGVVLVLHGTSNEHRVGPARLWVEVARSAAAAGHSVVRFDRRGTGESSVVTATEKTAIYDAASREDALVVAKAAGSPATRLVHAGICSGAWLSAYAAAEAGADAVVVVNTMVWTMRPPVLTQREIEKLNESHGAPDRIERAKIRLRALIRRLLPYTIWLWLGRCGIAQVPEVMLMRLRKRGVVPYVVLSSSDVDWFFRQRGGLSLRRLERRGWNQALVISRSGDHAAYEYGMRQLVRDEVATAMRKYQSAALREPANE